MSNQLLIVIVNNIHVETTADCIWFQLTIMWVKKTRSGGVITLRNDTIGRDRMQAYARIQGEFSIQYLFLGTLSLQPPAYILPVLQQFDWELHTKLPAGPARRCPRVVFVAMISAPYLFMT